MPRVLQLADTFRRGFQQQSPQPQTATADGHRQQHLYCAVPVDGECRKVGWNLVVGLAGCGCQSQRGVGWAPLVPHCNSKSVSWYQFQSAVVPARPLILHMLGLLTRVAARTHSSSVFYLCVQARVLLVTVASQG